MVPSGGRWRTECRQLEARSTGRRGEMPVAYTWAVAVRPGRTGPGIVGLQSQSGLLMDWVTGMGKRQESRMPLMFLVGEAGLG